MSLWGQQRFQRWNWSLSDDMLPASIEIIDDPWWSLMILDDHRSPCTVESLHDLGVSFSRQAIETGGSTIQVTALEAVWRQGAKSDLAWFDGKVGTCCACWDRNLPVDGEDMAKSCQVSKSPFQAKSKMLSCHRVTILISQPHFLGIFLEQLERCGWYLPSWLDGQKFAAQSW